MKQSELRKIIREQLSSLIEGELNEGKRRTIQFPIRAHGQMKALLKNLKPRRDYDFGVGSRGMVLLDIDVKYLDQLASVLNNSHIKWEIVEGKTNEGYLGAGLHNTKLTADLLKIATKGAKQAGLSSSEVKEYLKHLADGWSSYDRSVLDFRGWKAKDFANHAKSKDRKMPKYRSWSGVQSRSTSTGFNEGKLTEATSKSQKQLDILFKLSIGAHVKHGEDRLYKLSQAWESWNVDNDDQYDELVDPLFAAIELIQDAGEPGKNNVVKDKEYYSYIKSADKHLKQFNKDAKKAKSLHKEGVVTEARSLKRYSDDQLVRLYKQMEDERVSGSAAALFRAIAKELKKRKVKVEGKLTEGLNKTDVKYAMKMAFDNVPGNWHKALKKVDVQGKKIKLNMSSYMGPGKVLQSIVDEFNEIMTNISDSENETSWEKGWKAGPKPFKIDVSSFKKGNVTSIMLTEGKLNESVIGVKTDRSFKPADLTKALDKSKIKHKFNRLSMTLSVLNLDKKYVKDAVQLIHDLGPHVGAAVQMVKESVNEAADPWKRFDAMQKLQGQAMDIEMEMKGITNSLKLTHREMEQEAEPEGGPIADRYADQIDKLEKEYKKEKAELKKVFAKLDKLEQF